MNLITSKTNSNIKDLIRIRDDSKFRNDKSLFYVEGERIFKDSPKNLVKKIFVLEDKIDYFKNILSKFDDSIIYSVSPNVFENIKSTVNSQGIIALIEYNLMKSLDDNFCKRIKNCIILDSINDPGNLGTIIRLAEASSIDLIILANNCCNVYNTKTIRASMSSIFRTNIYISNNILDDLRLLKKCGFKIFATNINANSYDYYKLDFKDKNVIIFGNEANGVSNELLNESEDYIKIPMNGNIESLNVAISVAVICYEIMRQNLSYETKSK